MSWDFIHVQRKTYQGSDNWGVMYIKTLNDQWEKLCYSYELPWKSFESGPLKGKSKNSESRIRIGAYDLLPRSDGAKSWRLELQGTGHRQNIQIHRAHKSMFIEGCILPVHFNNFTEAQLSRGDAVIQTQSVALMQQIKTRYEQLSSQSNGKASIILSALLPAMILNSSLAKA